MSKPATRLRDGVIIVALLATMAVIALEVGYEPTTLPADAAIQIEAEVVRDSVYAQSAVIVVRAPRGIRGITLEGLGTEACGELRQVPARCRIALDATAPRV